MDTSIYWPFSTSKVTEWPGQRPAGWAYHVGTDFGVPQGTPLRATISGTAYLIWNDGYGAYVVDIVRPDGFVVRNGHLSRMDVANGQWVNAGDHIGLTGGAKGTPGAGLSTGPHLHWELRWNRNWNGPGWVDPRNLSIKSFDAPKPTPTPTPATPEEDEDMSRPMTMAKVIKGSTVEVTTSWPETGEERVFESTNTTSGQSYNRNVALSYGCAPEMPIVYITVSHYDAIRRANAETRARLDKRGK